MKTIQLNKSHFIENSVESEFNWLLHQLGITDPEEQEKIQAVELKVEDYNTSEEEYF